MVCKDDKKMTVRQGAERIILTMWYVKLQKYNFVVLNLIVLY
ncbi:hypothetical protein [Clostridioides difficile]